MDIYIGEKRKVKKVGDAFKITLDGVDYTVEGDDIAAGDQIQTIAKNGAGFLVKKVQK